MDPTQRRIVLIAASAAVVFVVASLFMAHPPESGVHWTLGGVGLVEGKGHMFFVLRDHMQLEVPRLVAAGIVSFAWILLGALVAFVAMGFRRMVSKR